MTTAFHHLRRSLRRIRRSLQPEHAPKPQGAGALQVSTPSREVGGRGWHFSLATQAEEIQTLVTSNRFGAYQFLNALTALLEDRFGSSAAGAHVSFGGHMIGKAVFLPQLLAKLGVASALPIESAYSGSKGFARSFEDALYSAGLLPDAVAPSGDSERVFDRIHEVCGKGGTFLCYKPSDLLALSDKQQASLDDYRRDGRLRFVVVNASDRERSKEVLRGALTVDLSDSILKGVEASIVGRQFALLGIRELHRLGQTLGSGRSQIVIAGGGDYGTALCEALLQMGVPREQIVMTDPDRDTRARLRRDLRVKCHHPDKLPKAEGTSRLVYVAVSGKPVPLGQIKRWGKSVVVGLTSGAPCLSPRFTEEATALEEVRSRQIYGGVNQRTLKDVDYELAGQRIRLINEGLPLNLADPFWEPLFTVTLSLVAAGIAFVSSLKADRRERVVPFPDELSTKIKTLYEEIVQSKVASPAGPLYRPENFSDQDWRRLVEELPKLGAVPEGAKAKAAAAPPPAPRGPAITYQAQDLERLWVGLHRDPPPDGSLAGAFGPDSPLTHFAAVADAQASVPRCIVNPEDKPGHRRREVELANNGWFEFAEGRALAEDPSTRAPEHPLAALERLRFPWSFEAPAPISVTPRWPAMPPPVSAQPGKVATEHTEGLYEDGKFTVSVHSRIERDDGSARIAAKLHTSGESNREWLQLETEQPERSEPDQRAAYQGRRMLHLRTVPHGIIAARLGPCDEESLQHVRRYGQQLRVFRADEQGRCSFLIGGFNRFGADVETAFRDIKLDLRLLDGSTLEPLRELTVLPSLPSPGYSRSV